MATLHAFFVSIDTYLPPVPPLSGCVNDGEAFWEYLDAWATAQQWTFRGHFLKNEAATRQAVITGFEHFAAAQAGDTCVFYFSGHGAQMPALPEFWNEADGLSETLVCYDSRLSDRDLLDKELGALIASVQKKGPFPFLVVTDCCHSGSATRALLSTDMRVRQAPVAPPVLRSASELWGYTSWLNGLPPVAPHIHLAAAQDDETAKECLIEGVQRGVFTYALVSALTKTAGQVSYADLMAQMGRVVRSKVSGQMPQLNAVGGASAAMGFLGGAVATTEPPQLAFDGAKGWWLNRGSFHGLDTEGVSIVCTDGRSYDIPKTDILAFECRVREADGADTTQTVPVVISTSDRQKKRVFLAQNTWSAAVIAQIEQAWQTLMPARLSRVEHAEEADYWVETDEKTIFLVQKGDTRPLFQPVPIHEAVRFWQHVADVTQFQATLSLHNPVSNIAPHALRCTLYDTNGQPLSEPLLRQNDPETPVYFRFSVTNEGPQPLFVSALFCGSDFSVSNAYLRTQKLNPGMTAWAEYDNSRDIPNMLPPEFLSWGINEVTEYIKVIAATEPLNTDIYNQDGLLLAEKHRAVPKPRLLSQDWRSFDVSYQLVGILPTQPLSTQPTALGLLTLTLPAGAQAKAVLSSSVEVSRALGGVHRSVAGAVALSTGRADSPEMTVLELSDWRGNVSETAPLQIGLGALAEQGTVLALAFDPVAGLYEPLSVSDAAGHLSLAYLPSPTATTRSLSGSIKIFFQKWLIKPLTGHYEYPLLRMAHFNGYNDSNFEYISDNQTIKSALAGARRVVLYIHGIIGDTELMAKAHRLPVDLSGRTLSNVYDVALTFDYESLDTPIEQTAFDLEKRLMAVGIRPDTGLKIDIVAHSMGGLVSRYFIEKLSGKSVVNRLFLFGTPSRGSEISNLMEWVKKMLAVGINGGAFWQPYLIPLSLVGRLGKKMTKTLAQMHPQSEFIRALNDLPDAHVPYFVVAGNTDLLQTDHPPQYSRLQQVLNHLKTHGHYEVANLLFDAPNDIAVKVTAIREVGRQSQVAFAEVAGDHLTYFIEKTPSLAQFAAFID